MNLSDFLYPGSRVAIVGSRDFPVPSLVEAFVSDLPEVIIVTGSNLDEFERGGSVNSCGGIVDLTAAKAARDFGIELNEFSPEWRRYGRGAGKVRNGLLVNSGLTVMVAFAKDPECLSSGTADVVGKALKARIPVFIFGTDGSETPKKAKSLQLQLF